MIKFERAVAPHNLVGYSNKKTWVKTSFKHPQEFFSKVSSLLMLVCALPWHWHNRLYNLPTIQQSTCGSTVQNQIKVYLSISDRSCFAKVQFRYLSEQWAVTNLILYLLHKLIYCNIKYFVKTHWNLHLKFSLFVLAFYTWYFEY